jgi:tetratricopeptide (TPR) repeat protein/GTPase SAR1 family protein
MAIANLHVSLVERDSGDVEFRYWSDDRNRSTQRMLPLAEVADFVRQSEDAYYAVTIPDLEDIGRRLYRWLDGTNRWLARELASLNTPVVALAIECRGGLANLPWETLHDGTTFLVRGNNPVVLPVRWRQRGPTATQPPNRALSVLFMATSPLGVQPELNYEEEEGRILEATRTYPLSLLVEETGTLDELGVLVRGSEDGSFDVLHLTGHAGFLDEGPRFLTESDTGAPVWVTAAAIHERIARKPSLIFLSGCRTAQSLKGGAVSSLAEELLDRGFPAVLGWGQPVLDNEATHAAATLYKSLNEGFSLVEAVLHVHAALNCSQAKHWHLLRLFVAGAMPAPLVTAPRTPGRLPPPPPSSKKRFLSKKDNVSGTIVDRKDFVGRRRPLQRFMRALRGNEHPAGIVIYGLGGVGKSSLACRLCDRLVDFEPAVHIGVLDEPTLLDTLEQLQTSADERAVLQGSREPLRHRLRTFLDLRQAAGRKRLLLVLDDFEQNTPLDNGQPLIRPQAQEIVESLVWAIEQTDAARCLITSRYELKTSQAPLFYQKPLGSLLLAEVEKKRRALSACRGATPELSALADRVSDGNPRLMERLDKLLGQKGLDHATILSRIEMTASEFREEVLLGELLSALPPMTRRMLAQLLVYEVPVPFFVVSVLTHLENQDLKSRLDAAASLGLLEQEPHAEETVYRVPRLLEPLLAQDRSVDRAALLAAAETAFCSWCLFSPSVPNYLEHFRLVFDAKLKDKVASLAFFLGKQLDGEEFYPLLRRLYEQALTVVRDYRVLAKLAEIVFFFGDGQRAYELLTEALSLCPRDDSSNRAFILLQLSFLKLKRGQENEALRILQKEVRPVFEGLGEQRELAAVLRTEAKCLVECGELEEALHVFQDEVLPVYQRLGETRARASTLAEVAGILSRRGEHHEALRILQDEVLPVYQEPDDARSRAETLSEMADIQNALGEKDEALRVLRDKVQPIYRGLGEVRKLAKTRRRVAAILQARGQRDEALQLLRDEVLPVDRLLQDERGKVATLEKVADILAERGELDEALRILQDEVQPAYKHINDMRSWALMLGQMAGILVLRGEQTDARHLLENKVVPTIRKLRDLAESAVLTKYLILLSDVCLKPRLRTKAVQYLGEARRIASHLGDTETLQLIQRRLITLGATS